MSVSFIFCEFLYFFCHVGGRKVSAAAEGPLSTWRAKLILSRWCAAAAAASDKQA